MQIQILKITHLMSYLIGGNVYVFFKNYLTVYYLEPNRTDEFAEKSNRIIFEYSYCHSSFSDSKKYLHQDTCTSFVDFCLQRLHGRKVGQPDKLARQFA